MTALLAQIPSAGVANFQAEIAWSTFAPELFLAVAALMLLMLSTARRTRVPVAILFGAIGVGVGGFLVSRPAAVDTLSLDQLPTYNLLVPGVIAIIGGATVVAAAIGFEGRPALMRSWIAFTAAAGAFALAIWQGTDVLTFAQPGVAELAIPRTELFGSVALDVIAFFTRFTVYLTTLFVIPMSHGYLLDRGIARAEFEPLLLLAAAGMGLLGAANDLIMMFLAIEILSIALYILSGMARRDRRSQESAIKYFVLGAVASAILLYGMALTYVGAGTLELAGIGERLQLATTSITIPVVGMALIIVGLGFKVALAPFHLWTPDVYQGAPTNVTAFMAAGTKAAGFAAVLRMLFVAFGPLQDQWRPLLAVLAAITMVYGALGALRQHDVKRILAYSSVAHAGYAAIGVVAASSEGLSGTLWYLVTYAVSTMAAFAALIAVERRRQGEVTLTNLRGLGRTSPPLAGLFALAILSLAGIPPTAGFSGKFVVFSSVIGGPYAWLAIVGLLASVVSAFFYLRLMGMMFLEDPEDAGATPILTTGLAAALAGAATLVIYLGVAPGWLLDSAERLSAVLAGG